MLVYLDTVIAIYVVEGEEDYRPRARSEIERRGTGGQRFAITDLTRLECRVQPLRLGSLARIAEYDLLFQQIRATLIPMTAAVFDRAAEIRAVHNFKLGDALHLAAAVESGCDAFLTNDVRLARFPGIAVEILT